MAKVKFGIFADLHVDIMHDTQARVEAFLDRCRREDVDFIIHLGDFVYPDDNRRVNCAPEHMPVNIANALKYKTYADKNAILRMYNDFEKPSYHVLGNHECDMCSKQELLDFIEAKDGSFYSFDQGGFHFIVLDPNFYQVRGEYHAYENGNYFEAGFDPTFSIPWLPPEQVAWLKEDLQNAKYPSVVFAHQTFSDLGAEAWGVRNRKEVREMFRQAPNRVLACFNGHHHLDEVTREEGIWYVQMNSMSCQWLDTEYTVLGRYGAEIDEKYPNIRYVAPFKDALYAIITMDDNGMDIRGTKSEYVGPSPRALGVMDPPKVPDEPGKWFYEAFQTKTELTAEQKDRYLPFTE